MKNALVFVGIGVIVIGVGLWLINSDFTSQSDSKDIMSSSLPIMGEKLTLTSSAFENDSAIPSRFTCDGANVSPPLSWNGVPEGTKSLVLIVDDPDVPKQLKPDGVFDHWTLFNIPPLTTEVAMGNSVGTVGANGAGKNQYAGPCPPKEYEPSEHRYFFRLYALDTKLELSEGASKADVLQAMEGHILAEAELMGKYQRIMK